jgi:hypothetical protein
VSLYIHFRKEDQDKVCQALSISNPRIVFVVVDPDTFGLDRSDGHSSGIIQAMSDEHEPDMEALCRGLAKAGVSAYGVYFGYTCTKVYAIFEGDWVEADSIENGGRPAVSVNPDGTVDGANVALHYWALWKSAYHAIHGVEAKGLQSLFREHSDRQPGPEPGYRS